MLRLVKYFKPYVIPILICIGLLFAQASTDLSLPNYMSEIINNGIQQGGIENGLPMAIRGSQMENLFLFTDSDSQAEILTYYSLVDNNSSDYSDVVKKYPQLAKEPIYTLNKISKEEIDKLSPVMGRVLLAVAGIQSAVENPELAANSGMASFDFSEIPEGMDIFTIMKSMPAEQKEQIIAAVNKQFSAMDENIISQLVVSVVKDEYKALGMDTDAHQINYIMFKGLEMLGLALIGVVCAILVSFLSSKVAAGFATNMRQRVFEKVESFSSAEFDKFSTASLITRTTNDVTQIQNLVAMMIRMACYAPIMGIGGIIYALDKSVNLSWTIAIAVSVLLGLIAVTFSLAMPKFKIVQKLIDKLNLVTRENLSGMMVIRAYNTQKFEEKRFDKANVELANTNFFINKVMSAMFPMMTLIMNGVTLLIVWLGAHQIAESALRVGDMMAFLQYAMQIVMSFLMLSMMFIFFPRASVSAVRIAEILETEVSVVDSENTVSLKNTHKNTGIVEYRNVCFRFPGAEEDTLHDISFVAKPGETTAFIGTTGSGKSTIINLLPRFYDVTQGEILLDGIDIRKVKQQELREKIGYIPQKGVLFTGTIESNLKYSGKNISDDVMKEAAEVAQALNFINEKEGGFDADISQGGVNVSGGQKQRLAIARALVKKSPIYIFDDSFSALDFKTDSILRKALKGYIKESTLLIVAQRVGTIMNAEQIIVLDEGNIVGKGTHKELMESCETYREIALSQLNKEELA